jgi:hypothetical protein
MRTHFNNILADLRQKIRASTASDTASTAGPHVAEAQQTIVQPIEGIIAGAAGTKPVASMKQAGGEVGNPPAVIEITPLISKFQRKQFKAVSKWTMAVNTFRP